MNLKKDSESLKNLSLFYKYVYTCEKCKTIYGSDKKENKVHRYPICEGKKI